MAMAVIQQQQEGATQPQMGPNSNSNSHWLAAAPVAATTDPAPAVTVAFHTENNHNHSTAPESHGARENWAGERGWEMGYGGGSASGLLRPGGGLVRGSSVGGGSAGGSGKHLSVNVGRMVSAI